MRSVHVVDAHRVEFSQEACVRDAEGNFHSAFASNTFIARVTKPEGQGTYLVVFPPGSGYPDSLSPQIAADQSLAAKDGDVVIANG